MKAPRKRQYATRPELRGPAAREKYEIHINESAVLTREETPAQVTVQTINDVFYRTRWQYAHSRRTTSVRPKFPSVGGPLDGTRAARGTEGYLAYAYADVEPWKRRLGRVMVHKSLVGQSDCDKTILETTEKKIA